MLFRSVAPLLIKAGSETRTAVAGVLEHYGHLPKSEGVKFDGNSKRSYPFTHNLRGIHTLEKDKFPFNFVQIFCIWMGCLSHQLNGYISEAEGLQFRQPLAQNCGKGHVWVIKWCEMPSKVV